MKDNYEDIINLERPISQNHPHMTNADRAAQFSPFAALTGYEEVISETGRLTERRIELEEYEKSILDEKLRRLKDKLGRLDDKHERLDDKPGRLKDKSEGDCKASITYFREDMFKTGGAYITATGVIKKFDEYERVLIMQDSGRIDINDIINIELEEN